MVVRELATADGLPAAAVGTTATGMFGSVVGPVGIAVSVGSGGALSVSSATTVCAAFVWIMPTSCVGSTGAGGADEPQALSTRLSTTKRTLVTKIRDLVFVFMGLLEAAWQQVPRACQA